MIDGKRAVVLHSFISGHFKNDPVVVNTEPAANHGAAAPEEIVGKAHTRAEVFIIRMMTEVNHIRHPHAGDGGHFGEIGARAVGRAGASGIGIVIPAQAEVQSEVAGDTPIVLRVKSDVTIGNFGNRHGLNGSGAFGGAADGNIKIVDDAVAIQIGKTKIGSEK